MDVTPMGMFHIKILSSFFYADRQSVVRNEESKYFSQTPE